MVYYQQGFYSMFKGKGIYHAGAKKMTLESKIFEVIFLIEKHTENRIRSIMARLPHDSPVMV